MELKLNVAFDSPLGSLEELIESLQDPAIILDDSLKVVAKNKNATRIFQNLRKGRAVGGMVLPEDKEKLRSLSVKQTVLIKLKNGETLYGATAVRFLEAILLVAHPLSADLRESLEAVYSKASGYDVSLLSSFPHKDELLMFSLSKLRLARGIRFFNVAAVVNLVINQLSEASKRSFERITVKSTLKENTTQGSEYDFSVVLAYLLSFCMGFAKDNVTVELFEESRVLSVRVSATPPNNSDEAEEILNGFSKDHVSWHNLIKMLSDGNLWDLETDCGYNNPISFTLKMPLSEEKQPFGVSDIFKEEITKIISAFFG